MENREQQITVDELIGRREETGLMAKGKAILRGAAMALMLAGFAAGAVSADDANIEQTVRNVGGNANVEQEVGNVGGDANINQEVGDVG